MMKDMGGPEERREMIPHSFWYWWDRNMVVKPFWKAMLPGWIVIFIANIRAGDISSLMLSLIFYHVITGLMNTAMRNQYQKPWFDFSKNAAKRSKKFSKKL